MSVAMIAITTTHLHQRETSPRPTPIPVHRAPPVNTPTSLSDGDYHARAAVENDTRAQRVECGARRREWGTGYLFGPSSAVVSDLMPHVSWAPLLGRHAAFYDLSSSWSGRGRTDR